MAVQYSFQKVIFKGFSSQAFGQNWLDKGKNLEALENVRIQGWLTDHASRPLCSFVLLFHRNQAILVQCTGCLEIIFVWFLTHSFYRQIERKDPFNIELDKLQFLISIIYLDFWLVFRNFLRKEGFLRTLEKSISS